MLLPYSTLHFLVTVFKPLLNLLLYKTNETDNDYSRMYALKQFPYPWWSRVLNRCA